MSVKKHVNFFHFQLSQHIKSLAKCQFSKLKTDTAKIIMFLVMLHTIVQSKKCSIMIKVGTGSWKWSFMNKLPVHHVGPCGSLPV